MTGVLVVAEARRGELRDISLELVEAGRSLKAASGGRLAVAVLGADPGALAGALGADGVDEILTVAVGVAEFEPHVWQSALEALIEREQPAVLLAGHTIDGLGYGPALAAAGGHGFASDVTALAWGGDGLVATRGAYGGKLEVELEFGDRPTVIVMVRAGTYAPAEVAGGSPAPVRAVDVDIAEGVAASEHVAWREVETGDVDITKADFLLSIGRGVEEREAIEQFEGLAERMGATLSVSRPLVDAGWMPGARQVGQSGKTVKPKVYLALGISGAVQHLAGMRGAETIIAVNSDPEAPIFSVAHYGAVADLFEVADELEQQFG